MAQSAGNPVLADKINNGDNAEVVNLDDCDEKLEVGIKVGSEDEAYDLYNLHALRKGFSIRKGNRRFIDGALRQREYVCSKAGFREYERCNPKKVNRLETRTGCTARIRFTITDGTWEVTYFNDVHNHEFASQEKRHRLRSGRRVLVAHTRSTPHSDKQFGDAKNVVKKDSPSYLHSVNKVAIEPGDGQGIINHFSRRQVEDPLFFFSVQVDQENRMTNFFWRDGRSKLDYDMFGDVVIFDTTYRTNKYNLICAPFLGINHHWKNILFGCALLLDETTESYIWLFRTFLDSMGGQQPKIIFTEQDQAMENAIEIVFSESRHRLCFWHIPNNSKKHLAEIYSNPSFGAKFSQCLNGCLDEMEFQSTWEDMIKTFNLEDNVWLNRLYETRAKWCTAFEVDIFSAKMKTTLRSESMYSVFRQLLGASLSLIQVIEHYERKAEDMRKGERDDDLNCKNSAFSNVVPHGGILQHAANVYTTRLFEMFREEFLEGLEMSYIEGNGEGVATYELYKHGEKKVFTVKFDKSDYTISCSCKLFETLGLLCCHALRVFLVNNVNEIPAQYILRRWTNNARKEAICYPTESSNYASKSSHASRLSDLFHFGRFVFEKGSSTARAAKIVKEKLMEALELIENDLGNLNMVEGVNGKSIQSNIASVDNEMQWSDENMQVFDPTRGRKKNQLEKKSKKKVKGSADTQMLQPRCNPMLHSCSSQMSQPATIQMPQPGLIQMSRPGIFQATQLGFPQVPPPPFRML
ncbi:protein FAR1-RELATED SEQUENCE 9-like [Ananas comosus]|uniref:Protein FAR1-RELATED SEQUENCE 9-like n=1 Tax=Ananas comosus TaxID=4615 RepID=A0A6P5F3M6_ANACO|nr:protein FAR1-RELATED SEQUENCE 9-like [Ananas comosus]XP_020090554.1 protein FAR1-RELATED SEQUENCE 9-like [Ananas comosus]